MLSFWHNLTTTDHEKISQSFKAIENGYLSQRNVAERLADIIIGVKIPIRAYNYFT